MKRLAVSWLFCGLIIALAACSAARPAETIAVPATSAQPTYVAAASSQQIPGPATPVKGAAPPAVAYLAQTDQQGAVTFAVSPLNLSAPGKTLDFNVSMNTHSVNLGWNLAAQSTLATDTGRQVQGQSWPIGNGHHYQGTLSFPAETADGARLLDGAKRLTLTIRGTDVAERVFIWDLAQ